MTYDRFLRIIMGLKRQDEVLHELYEKKVDLLDFADPYQQAITELIKEVYGEEGYDWWSWFCYESDYGTKDWSNKPVYTTNQEGNIELIPNSQKPRWGAIDENGEPICYSFESTWNFLEEIRKKRLSDPD